MAREEEIAALRQKLAAREKQPGWAKNADAIKRRIAELEAAE